MAGAGKIDSKKYSIGIEWTSREIRNFMELGRRVVHEYQGSQLVLPTFETSIYSGTRSKDTPLYGHPDITDSFDCPDEKLIHVL